MIYSKPFLVFQKVKFTLLSSPLLANRKVRFPRKHSNGELLNVNLCFLIKLGNTYFIVRFKRMLILTIITRMSNVTCLSGGFTVMWPSGSIEKCLHKQYSAT